MSWWRNWLDNTRPRPLDGQTRHVSARPAIWATDAHKIEDLTTYVKRLKKRADAGDEIAMGLLLLYYK